MMWWILKSMSRPPEDILEFRWTHGCHAPGEEHGVHPPPNTQTKEKMRKYKLQKAGRRISLFRTAGKPRQMRNSHWSPRPEARPHVHPYSERRTPSPHKKQQSAQGHQPNHSAQTLLHKKRQREDYSDGSSTDSAPTNTYYEQSNMAGRFHSTALSPESPPEYEKGLSNVDYIPKSPIYPPPDVFSDASDEDSLIDLTDEDFEEEHSDQSQKNPRQSEGEGTLKDPSSERKTDQDPSHKSEEPQFADKTEQPKSETDDQLLDKLSRIADTVNPVIDEDYWKKRRESNIYLRLDMAAQKLKEWQKAEDKEDPPEESQENPQAKDSGHAHKEDLICLDQATQVPTGSKDSSTQKYLEERPLTFPVEPMTCPPDIVHPIPSSSLQMPPDVPANFSTKLNKVAKMRTGPICYKAKLVDAMTTRPRVILQRLPIQDIKIHSATI